MTTQTVAELAKYRFRTAARRLGAADPTGVLRDFFDRSFELPVGDPSYGRNSFLPGYLPLEHSFSEVAPNSLRFAMEPLGPNASADRRRHEVSREVRRLVDGGFGPTARHWFDERSEPWRGASTQGAARFGAWFGASFDAGGLQEAKAYYEMDKGRVDDLPPNLQHAARVAMALLPGLVPIFTSVACGRASGAQRVYFFHTGDLRLLELEPLMNRLGIGHQLPSLLTAIGLILGGRFVLPEGSVVLALRDTNRGLEMKLEVLMPGLADPPRDMHRLVHMHLAQRPQAQRALSQWIAAMTPDGYQTPGDVNVVSVRVDPQRSARLALYFRPSGYDRAASRERSVPMVTPVRDTWRIPSNDPYTLHP